MAGLDQPSTTMFLEHARDEKWTSVIQWMTMDHHHLDPSAIASFHVTADLNRFYLSAISPEGIDNFAIRWACQNGHAQIVRMLLADKRGDPSAGGNDAIRWTSCQGHANVVCVLLDDHRVDPSAGDNDALLTLCRRLSLYRASASGKRCADGWPEAHPHPL
jgi:hypothetical protein